MFKIELHAHTSEVSDCSQLPAAAVVDGCLAAGYNSLVITDHLTHYFVEIRKAQPWETTVSQFLSGYIAAKETGKMPVLLGMEYRNFESHNDYLVFGVTEGFLLQNPGLCRLPLSRFFDLCERAGLLLFQAHPFRPDMIRANPAFLHGVEVHNGNIRHNSNNALAAAFAREHSLLGISGSDLHQPCDFDRGGILTERAVPDNASLLSVLRTGQYTLLL